MVPFSRMDILGGTDISGSLESLTDFFIHFGTDFFAFIIVAAAVSGFAFYFGRDRLMSLIASIYAAVLLYQKFPYGSYVPDGPWYEIGIFALFVVVALIAFSGLSFFLARETSSFLGTAALSIATAGLLLSIAIYILPVQQLYTFSAPTMALFSSAESFFLWLLAPLVALFFFGR